jgi:methylmalonyl-CoA mutase
LGESHEKKYGANERAQMLKYHIQTSRSCTHKKLISMIFTYKLCTRFMTTVTHCIPMRMMKQLQHLQKNQCRAMAIQLIINKELGRQKMKPNSRCFYHRRIDLLKAVLLEFDRITERGGVLGAMETMYQRSKIQEESLYYET